VRIPETDEVREAYQGSGEGGDFKRAYHEQGEAFAVWLGRLVEDTRTSALEEAARLIEDAPNRPRNQSAAAVRALKGHKP
jgi:hypothetical protein